jgi:uncharacterized membrane protein
MALRLLQAHVPTDLAPKAEAALADASAREIWTENGGPMGSVVTAVALLPPIVPSGMLLGDGYLKEAAGAFLLVMANVMTSPIQRIVPSI